MKLFPIVAPLLIAVVVTVVSIGFYSWVEDKFEHVHLRRDASAQEMALQLF